MERPPRLPRQPWERRPRGPRRRREPRSPEPPKAAQRVPALASGREWISRAQRASKPPEPHFSHRATARAEGRRTHPGGPFRIPQLAKLQSISFSSTPSVLPIHTQQRSREVWRHGSTVLRLARLPFHADPARPDAFGPGDLRVRRGRED